MLLKKQTFNNTLALKKSKLGLHARIKIRSLQTWVGAADIPIAQSISSSGKMARPDESSGVAATHKAVDHSISEPHVPALRLLLP